MMSKFFIQATAFSLGILLCASAFAQSGRGGGRGNSGGRSNSGGSFQEGGQGGFGGFQASPGGFQGGPGGNWGGGMMIQGMPGGGMGGGPPGGMMGMGRGDGSGAMGGMGSGGFDPSGFLSRMDFNGNGLLDPDELQGPARFILERVARGNPNIDLSQPIPIATLTGEFERMRSGRGGESGGGGFPGWGYWGGDFDEGSVQSKSLVPGFGTSKSPPKVLGFGSEAEVFSTRVLEEDMREAEERLRRYDSNRDGSLDQGELAAGRFRDNPMQYDRNGDGKLSKEELAVRYARLRVARNSNGNQSSGGNENDRRRSSTANVQAANSGWANYQISPPGGSGRDNNDPANSLWDERATYRTNSGKQGSSGVQGLPSWFVDADANGDGQVSMKEFASNWNDSVVQKFLQFDTNQDGFITAKECLEATKKGILADRSLSSSGVANSGGSESGSAGRTSTAPSADRASKIPVEGMPENADKRWVDWCIRKIEENDKNKNGYLSIDEWRTIDGDFAKVDTNGDGQISAAEYYLFKKKK